MNLTILSTPEATQTRELHLPPPPPTCWNPPEPLRTPGIVSLSAWETAAKSESPIATEPRFRDEGWNAFAATVRCCQCGHARPMTIPRTDCPECRR